MKNDSKLLWCVLGKHFLEEGEVLYGNSCIEHIYDEGERTREKQEEFGIRWINDLDEPREDN